MRALIYEDVYALRYELIQLVETLQISTEGSSFDRATDALAWIKLNPLDDITFAILDIVEGDSNYVGVKLALAIRAKAPSIPIVFHSAHKVETVPDIGTVGTFAFVDKGPNYEELMDAIEKQVEDLPIRPSQYSNGLISIAYGGVSMITRIDKIICVKNHTETIEVTKLTDNPTQRLPETAWEKVPKLVAGGANPSNALGFIFRFKKDADKNCAALLTFEGNDVEYQVEKIIEKYKSALASPYSSPDLFIHDEEMLKPISEVQAAKYHIPSISQSNVPIISSDGFNSVLVRRGEFRSLKILVEEKGTIVEKRKPNLSLAKFQKRIVDPYLRLHRKKVQFKVLPSVILNLKYLTEVDTTKSIIKFTSDNSSITEEVPAEACRQIVNFSNFINI